MYGIFIIFLFYYLGILLSSLTGEFIPGSVIGMVLLFLALASGLVKAHKVKTVAEFITKNMALYFVPVGVGMLVSLHFMSQAWPLFVLVSVVSMILVMISTGGVYQIMERWKK